MSLVAKVFCIAMKIIASEESMVKSYLLHFLSCRRLIFSLVVEHLVEKIQLLSLTAPCV